MGGHGSGRWPAAPVIEDFPRLDVRAVSRAGALTAGTRTRWPLEDGLGHAQGSVEIHAREEAAELHFVWVATNETVTATVMTTKTPCNFGGHRPWWLCPGCEARVAILYAAQAAFRCRSCLGAVYLSTRESSLGRAALRARRARLRLGCGSVDEFPNKPPRMRWTTFLRHAHIIYSADREVDAALRAEVDHLVEQYRSLVTRAVERRARASG